MNLHQFVPLALSLLAITLWEPAATADQRSAAKPTAGQILEAIGVRQGSTVCEIGAGEGEISVVAARIVGPNGRVYTSELGDARTRKLRDTIAGTGLAQVTVVAGDGNKTNFPDAGCDSIFMRDVYHHLSDPASMNLSISASLKPGGRVAVVDFTPPGKEAHRPADRAQNGTHGVSPETVLSELRDAGFEPVSSDLRGQRWFMVVVSKQQHDKD